MRMLSFALLGTLFASVFALPAEAQSFNCRYARSADEVLICQEPQLSRLDEELAAVYARVRSRTRGSDLEELTAEQASWLRGRKECGRDYRCVESYYRRRIAQLREL
jgi:uncharacterized protein